MPQPVVRSGIHLFPNELLLAVFKACLVDCDSRFTILISRQVNFSSAILSSQFRLVLQGVPTLVGSLHEHA